MQRHNTRPTIKEIAKRVGTSTATVSRVLNGLDYPVSPLLREQVLAVAAALHYTPNLIGRSLKNCSSSDIGVIIPTLSNPFYASLLAGIEGVLDEHGYSLLLCNSLRDEVKQQKYVELLQQKQVEGLMISPISDVPHYLTAAIEQGLKVIVFDQTTADSKINRVAIDYKQAVFMAVAHLYEQGHRDIGFMSAPLTRHNRQLTFAGYQRALQAYGLSYNPDWTYLTATESEACDCCYEFENGRNLVKKYLATTSRPSALLVINDVTAYGVLAELNAQAIKVPEELSLISFDNLIFSTVTEPPLTTVGFSAYEIGQRSAECLVRQLQGSDDCTQEIIFAPELVIRGSVSTIDF